MASSGLLIAVRPSAITSCATARSVSGTLAFGRNAARLGEPVAPAATSEGDNILSNGGLPIRRISCYINIMWVVVCNLFKAVAYNFV